MKIRVGYLFWIIMLALGLMILVAAAQMLTTRNINGLQEGNREAAITFSVNNRLQDLINLSFELESKLLKTVYQKKQEPSIQDSLTILGYNASLLQDINLNEQATAGFKKLNDVISRQIEISLSVLNKNNKNAGRLADSLQKLHIADSVYAIALSIQRYLEQDLESTLASNTRVSGKLSSYNKILAMIAIGAVLISATIIINRHIRQRQLIAKLEEATAAATKSAMIKDQFLANMSHEIRTPLNAIIGFSRLLSQTSLTDSQKQYSTIINEAGKNLMNIVNDILDIAKIEAGKMRIESKEFGLSSVVQTLENMFKSEAAEKGLGYFHQIDKNVPLYLKGDPERLVQVLINLISNAIKFTHEGFVQLSVTLHKEEEKKNWIHFSVKDTGVGVPEEMHEKIFQRFEQLVPDGGQLTKGTGLGLSIVKGLVHQMGGSISMASEYGKGSEFTVLLPFEKATQPGKRETIYEPLSSDFYYVNANVLVVEDNPVNQLFLKHVLAEFSIQADMASNGKEAVEAVRKKEYDLIFLDIQMPLMDGYTALSAMKSEAHFSTPVVAMTAYTMPGEKEKSLKAGMDDYIAKPVEINQLAAVLEKYLPHKKRNQKINNQANYSNSFLVNLAGGDKEMAHRILSEIVKEIPNTIKRLQDAKQSPDPEKMYADCHHMISTFSPLGDDTQIMKKIRKLQNRPSQLLNKNYFANNIDDIIQELFALKNNLQETLKQEYIF